MTTTLTVTQNNNHINWFLCSALYTMYQSASNIMTLITDFYSLNQTSSLGSIQPVLQNK